MFSKKGILCRCKVTHFPKIMALSKQILHKKIRHHSRRATP